LRRIQIRTLLGPVPIDVDIESPFVGLVCAPKEKRTKMAAREMKIMSSAGIDLDVAFAAFVKAVRHV
jgi:hypothetical protein